MAGYSSDQFYNFGTYETGRSLNRNVNDNPKFIYPRSYTVDLGKVNEGYTTKRGFIRGILPSLLGAKERRLFFQFNPATVERSVQQNEMVRIPLLQNPAQIAQSVPGNASFQFELLFNREAEVTSKKVRTDSERLTSNLSNKFKTENINPFEMYGEDWDPTDVASIGVLADLYVLDTIIGQSITPDQVSVLRKYDTWAQTPSTTGGTAGNAGESVKDTISSLTGGPADFDTRYKANIGNGAFLAPMPIRIVFSSLLMVEGLVESSNVVFVKFTKDYVPTVCKVSLTVRGLYFGFSKSPDKTYLSSTLSQNLNQDQSGGGASSTPTTWVPPIAAGSISGLNIGVIPKDFFVEYNKPFNDGTEVFPTASTKFKDYANEGNKKHRIGGTLKELSVKNDSLSPAGKPLADLVKTMTSSDVKFYLEITQILTVTGTSGGKPTKREERTVLYNQPIKLVTNSASKSAVSSSDFLRLLSGPVSTFSYLWGAPSLDGLSGIMNQSAIGADSESGGTRKRKIEMRITAFIEVITPGKTKKSKPNRYRTTLTGNHLFSANSTDDFTNLKNGKIQINLRQTSDIQWRQAPLIKTISRHRIFGASNSNDY